MNAQVLLIKNISREGPGLFRNVLINHRISADVIDLERDDEIPSLRGYRAVVVLGGPASANDVTPTMLREVALAREALESSVPYLGVCLGHQVLAKAAGGGISEISPKEIGFYDQSGNRYGVDLTEAGRADPLFEDIDSAFDVFQLHGETVTTADGVETLATSNGDQIQAIRVGTNAYGLQMHVEVTPEMLAIWCAQDGDLADRDTNELQRQLAEISASYIAVGSRLFENFLSIAELATAIDLTERHRVDVK